MGPGPHPSRRFFFQARARSGRLVRAQVACNQQLSTAAVILAFVGIAIGSRPRH